MGAVFVLGFFFLQSSAEQMPVFLVDFGQEKAEGSGKCLGQATSEECAFCRDPATLGFRRTNGSPQTFSSGTNISIL
ncbi:hypothetical protein MPNT_180030 [Candidatus Methylacidithermus pantelleriae]|uniref:Uncharacterized protein n=1 Tax=Candidatus Methylacidithermus pantelleriae TaxID=2744239 RepID=A0A8J2BL16_9BACT|nr:hypothetical protein MPNT_180030 [Candidatus Methylacidithermus pantelleriae]